MVGQSTVFVVFAVTIATVVAAPNPECRKRPKGFPKDCCALPSNSSAKEFMKCIAEAAKAKTCPNECLFGGVTVLTADGVYDRPTILETLTTTFDDSDPAFGELHEKHLDHCIEVIDKKIEKWAARADADAKQPDCNFRPAALFGCLMDQYLRNCPASAWTESDTCTEWKGFFEKCPRSGLMRMGPHGPGGRGGRHGPPGGPPDGPPNGPPDGPPPPMDDDNDEFDDE